MTAPAPPSAWRGGGEERETALVVDDDRINRATIAEILAADCRVLLARDGESALEILAREVVSLVLLDVSMPGLSGYEVLMRMQADPVMRDIPVIFITGMSEETDEEYGLRLGAVDYVQKPVRPAIVRARAMTQLNLLRQRRTLKDLAMRDGLTGVGNRRAFDEALDQALRYAHRKQTSLALGIFDVDHFKQYNDHYGHGAGDQALKRVAEILSQSVRRAGDVLARYGGEEFVLLMPECLGFAEVMSEACARVRAEGISHAASRIDASVLTVSGGGVIAGEGMALSAEQLLAQADALLYRAKAGGRNRCFVQGAQG